MANWQNLEQVAEGIFIRPELRIEDAIDLYLGDKAQQGRKERTRNTYRRYLWKFCDGLPRYCDVAQIEPDEVRRFLDKYLRHSRGTQAQVFSVLSGFFKWAVFNQKIKVSPMERIMAPNPRSTE